MWWYGNGMGGWSVALMMIGTLLPWALVVLGGVALLRHGARAQRAATPGPRPTPEQLLAERFARGEIDEQEYRSRLDTVTRELRARVEP